MLIKLLEKFIVQTMLVKCIKSKIKLLSIEVAESKSQKWLTLLNKIAS